jgi:hypothetical protein
MIQNSIAQTNINSTKNRPNPKPKMPPMALIKLVRGFTNFLEQFRIKLMPPQVTMLQMLTGFWMSRSLYVAAKLGIADLLADRAKSTQELATATRTHERALYRLLRALASVNVLSQDRQGNFALTDLGKTLNKDSPNSLKSMALFLGDDTNWQSWGEALYSMHTAQPAFDVVFDSNYFQYLDRHPETSSIFDNAMTAMETEAYEVLGAAYDFSQFETVADIGGGHGKLMQSILEANPQLNGIVFDLDRVVVGARRSLSAAGLKDRCQFISGNFFQSVPSGGDLYILSAIIHDWNDEKALQILKNCYLAMPKNAKLLLLEMILPADNTPHFGKFLDLQMLFTTNGMERTEAEYRNLLSEAGFQVNKIIPTPATNSIIEAVKV